MHTSPCFMSHWLRCMLLDSRHDFPLPTARPLYNHHPLDSLLACLLASRMFVSPGHSCRAAPTLIPLSSRSQPHLINKCSILLLNNESKGILILCTLLTVSESTQYTKSTPNEMIISVPQILRYNYIYGTLTALQKRVLTRIRNCPFFLDKMLPFYPLQNKIPIWYKCS